MADGDDVVERVGFYYAANSAGRLLGTLLSGALFTGGNDGLSACLIAAFALAGFATAATLQVRESH